MDIGTIIINWYKVNARDLPWRNTIDPYTIWVSEIIMQQTRIDQGLPYYINFMKTFPTVFDLANAEEDLVMLKWQGLGYYSRARNMHFTAQYIVNELNGVFPDTANDLLQLKGIGKYTAAAISSICYNENIAAIDGNVIRVIARLFNISDPVNKPEALKEIDRISAALVKNKDASAYNQAMMDLGASICTPKLAKCEHCPLQSKCLSLAKGTYNSLPIKEKTIKIKNRFLVYIINKTKTEVLIKKRTGNDIWKGLHEFELIELKTKPDINHILEDPEIRKYLDKYSNPEINLHEVKAHKLSHQTIYAYFVSINLNTLPQIKGYFAVRKDKTHDYAFPKLIEKHLNELLGV